MRPFLIPLFLILAAIVIRRSDAQSPSLDARRAELKRLLHDEWEYTLRTSPEFATMVGDDRYNDRLSDHSAKAVGENLEHERQALKQFEALDISGFPEQEKLNHALMVRSLRETVESASFKNWEMPATQFGGIHLQYASLPADMFTFQPRRNLKRVELGQLDADPPEAIYRIFKKTTLSQIVPPRNTGCGRTPRSGRGGQSPVRCREEAPRAIGFLQEGSIT